MKILYVIPVVVMLFGCATSDETSSLRFQISSVQNQMTGLRNEMNDKMSAMRQDNENLRQQLLGFSATIDGNNDKMRDILGKLDELDHRMKRTADDGRKPAPINQKEPVFAGRPGPEPLKPEFEDQYKAAFGAFQKGSYRESARLFKEFLEATPETPLRPNAYFWLGESYINIKEHEKAVLSFQELIDRYPKNERIPRALLSQAEAFSYLGDKRSAATVLKKIVDTYPQSEESAVAERMLKNLPASPPPAADKKKKTPGEGDKKTDGVAATVITETANLRTQPSVNSSIVAWVMKGTPLVIVDQFTEPGGRKWVKARTKGGKEGWIAERMVKQTDRKRED